MLGRKINPGGYPITGPRGEAGAIGPAGPQGDIGPQGSQGIQGIPGTPGADGADGTDGREVEFQQSATHIQWRYVGDVLWTDLVALAAITGPTGATGAAGVDGVDGAAGRGITSIARTSGTGAAGTTDTYTITYTDATTSTFNVYNGADGSGSGDVVGPAGTTDGYTALFDGITGKLIKAIALTWNLNAAMRAVSLSGNLTLANNLTTSGNFALTLTTTAATNVTFPTTGTLATLAGTETLTNKRLNPRVTSETSSATPTINTDNTDCHRITALAVNITSFTTNLTGTPVHGQGLLIEITGTAARTIAWGASFEASTVALPTTTVTTAMLSVAFIWNSTTSKWRCIGVV